MLFYEIIQCLFAGFKIGIIAFIEALGIKDAIDGLREQLLAAFLGVPVWVISLVSFLLLVSPLIGMLIKRHASAR